MKHLITEEHVEENVLEILKSLDYNIIRGSNEEYLPGGSSALRSDYKDVVLIEKQRICRKKNIHRQLTETRPAQFHTSRQRVPQDTLPMRPRQTVRSQASNTASH